MTQVMVFQKPVYKRHYANMVSSSNFVNLLGWVLQFLLPFLAAYSSYNFWIKESIFREQPIVLFKQKLLMVMETKISDRNYSITWGTSPAVNELFSSSTRACVLETSEVDTNQDGIPDSINISLEVPLREDEEVYRASVVAAVQYSLKDRTEFSMESLAFLDQSSPISGRSLVSDGDIVLKQRIPMTLKGGAQVWYNNASDLLLESDENSSVSNFLLENILKKYNERDFRTQYEINSSLWLSAGPTKVVGGTRNFKIDMTLRLPQQAVDYYTNWSECMKFAFVQYVPLFLLCQYLIRRIRKYLYENQVFETQFVVDTQFGRQKQHHF